MLPTLRVTPLITSTCALNHPKPQNLKPLNPKPLNPQNLKPLNPKPLNPKPQNLKPLNPKPQGPLVAKESSTSPLGGARDAGLQGCRPAASDTGLGCFQHRAELARPVLPSEVRDDSDIVINTFQIHPSSCCLQSRTRRQKM